jgi:large subunit ribosomal protein L44e
MKISKEIESYCKTCKKHTTHAVRNYSKGAASGLNIATRRHNRAIRGYVGSVEPKVHPKKLGKRQKVIIECKTCKKKAERVFGQRTKKKIEIKR